MFFLQLKEKAMGTVFAPTYANLTITYHKIQVYFVIKNTYSLVVSKFFEENWFRLLDDCEILLNTKLIKPNDLLTILNQVNPNLQFTMERSTTNLPFLDIMINKLEQKFGWIYTTNLLIQKDTCLLRQITREVVSEIFRFVWLDASVLLSKKKKQN